MPAVASNGIRIFYEEMGVGEPIVLIMGIGCQLIHWRDAFCQMLVDQGYRVIRMDNRDAGLSTHMHGERFPSIKTMATRRAAGLRIDAPYRLEDMAQDTVGLLDALGIDQATVVGASMGGMIAQTLAIHNPDRVRSLVSIMAHTGERRFLLGRPDAIRVLLSGAPPRTPEEAGERTARIMAALGSPGFPTDPAEYHSFGAKAFQRSHDPPAFGRQLAAILASGHRVAGLAKLQVPTLVIHGQADPLISRSAGRRMARLIPDADLWAVPGMGHDLPEQLWPEVTARIATFARDRARSVA